MLLISEQCETTWDTFHWRWRRLQPPLRPDADVCANVAAQIARCADHVLVLGVTPELASLGTSTMAIDWSETALRFIWPGDTDRRRALRGSWLDLPVAAGAFSAAIGDGSLSCLEYPCGYQRVLGELARVVRPGGRVALRVYLRPERDESLADVRSLAMAGEIATIEALKWRVAHALCAERRTPGIEVQLILQAFDQLFDRGELARVAGWSLDDIAQLDAYATLPDVFTFLRADQLLASVPSGFEHPRLVSSGSYELADRCPLLVLDRRI